MKKLLKLFMPHNEIKDFHLRKKTEYTVIFLILLNLYITPAVIIESWFVFLTPVQIIFNIFLIIFCLFLFFPLKKGMITFTISLLIAIGFLKAAELMFNPHSSYFFSLFFLVIIGSSAIHTSENQLKYFYISAVTLLVFKLIIAWNHLQQAAISTAVFTQILHSTHSAAIFLVTVFFINKIIEREIMLSSDMEKIATTDVLTGAYNRRKFIETEKIRENRCEKIFCMIDIDHFKKVNDSLGHEAGDIVLGELTALIKNILRQPDMLYRWGGEEFLLVLDCDNEDSAFQIADRIRKAVMDNNFYENVRITISAGLSKMNPDEDFMEPLRRADAALYRAKDAGRNRVEPG